MMSAVISIFPTSHGGEALVSNELSSFRPQHLSLSGC